MSTDRVTDARPTTAVQTDETVSKSLPAVQRGRENVHSARRRLLGGVVAAPAVLALHSGSALANASANNCVQQQLKDPLYPSSKVSTDNWVRVQLCSLRPEANSSSVRWYISGASLDALGLGSLKVQNHFLSSGSWLEFDPGPPEKTKGNVLPSTPRWSQNKIGVLGPGPKWVAVRFDATSNQVFIIGVVSGTASGTAVAGTCWASVRNMA